ncbi:MAG: DUF2254 family protein [Chthoniobacteraceae bacterium]
MNKLKRLWSNLRTSFWFVPSLIVAVSIVLAVALIEVDSSGSERWLARGPRMFGAGAEGARGMLSTIAGSMMTAVGVPFSMTLVTLALVSSAYAPAMTERSKRYWSGFARESRLKGSRGSGTDGASLTAINLHTSQSRYCLYEYERHHRKQKHSGLDDR